MNKKILEDYTLISNSNFKTIQTVLQRLLEPSVDKHEVRNGLSGIVTLLKSENEAIEMPDIAEVSDKEEKIIERIKLYTEVLKNLSPAEHCFELQDKIMRLINQLP